MKELRRLFKFLVGWKKQRSYFGHGTWKMRGVETLQYLTSRSNAQELIFCVFSNFLME